LRDEGWEVLATWGELGDKKFDLVFFIAVERFELCGINPLPVDAKEFKAFFYGPACDFGMKTFSSTDERGKEIEAFGGAELAADAKDDIGGSLPNGNFPSLRIVLGSEFSVEKAKKLVELGDGGDGRFTTATGGALFDGDGGRKSGDGIDIRFLELFDKLASVGVEAVEVAALAFAEEKIEGEGAFAGTRKAGDDDHLIAGNLKVEIL